MVTAMYAIIVIISFSMISSFVYFLRPLETLIRALYPFLPRKSHHPHFLSFCVPLRTINLIGDTLVISTFFLFGSSFVVFRLWLMQSSPATDRRVMQSAPEFTSPISLGKFSCRFHVFCFFRMRLEYISKISTNTVFGTSYFHATMKILPSSVNKIWLPVELFPQRTLNFWFLRNKKSKRKLWTIQQCKIAPPKRMNQIPSDKSGQTSISNQWLLLDTWRNGLLISFNSQTVVCCRDAIFLLTLHKSYFQTQSFMANQQIRLSQNWSNMSAVPKALELMKNGKRLWKWTSLSTSNL